MKDIESFNTVSIDFAALQHNFRILQKKAADSLFLAMVKADAYGHGMLECSRALEKGGCQIFGVAELTEAVELRKGGITSQIFSMVGFDNDNAEIFSELDITPVVFDEPSLRALSRAATHHNKVVSVHLKVDTGMSRLGVQLNEIDKMLGLVDTLPGLELGGIASHFPCADDITSPTTDENFDMFGKFLQKIKERQNLINHTANSGGTLYFPKTQCDMVRCGISLYGYYPEGRVISDSSELQPVMSFSTRVVQVKEIPEGTGVSYGHTYITDRPTKIAVLPVGYEDGYSRKLSNCGEVLLRGKRAPVRGRVCMNLCMVDVTEIDGVQQGDTAVLLGKQGDEHITADELAERIGTISYEVLCMIGNNNQRKYR